MIFEEELLLEYLVRGNKDWSSHIKKKKMEARVFSERFCKVIKTPFHK